MILQILLKNLHLFVEWQSFYLIFADGTLTFAVNGGRRWLCGLQWSDVFYELWLRSFFNFGRKVLPIGVDKGRNLVYNLC